MAGGECTATGVRPTRKSGIGEKSREPAGSLQLFADELAVFPDDQGQAEAFVFGAEFAGRSLVGAHGDLAFFAEFGYLHRGQLFVFSIDHY